MAQHTLLRERGTLSVLLHALRIELINMVAARDHFLRGRRL